MAGRHRGHGPGIDAEAIDSTRLDTVGFSLPS